MSATPQQPELRRSGLGSVGEQGTEVRAQDLDTPDEEGRGGPVPEDNAPGHRPAHDQDKPEVPPHLRHDR